MDDVVWTVAEASKYLKIAHSSQRTAEKAERRYRDKLVSI